MGDEMVVGHLANNSIEKGTVDLLQAVSQAWAGGARFRLVLAVHIPLGVALVAGQLALTAQVWRTAPAPIMVVAR